MKKTYCFIIKAVLALMVMVTSMPLMAQETLPDVVEMENINAIFVQKNWNEYDDQYLSRPAVVLKSRPTVIAKVVTVNEIRGQKISYNDYYLGDDTSVGQDIIVLRTPGYTDNEKGLELPVGKKMPVFRGEVEYINNEDGSLAAAPLFVMSVVTDSEGSEISNEDFAALLTEDGDYYDEPASIVSMQELLAKPADYHGKRVAVNVTGTYDDMRGPAGATPLLYVNPKKAFDENGEPVAGEVLYLNLQGGQVKAAGVDSIARITLKSGRFDWGSTIAGSGVVANENNYSFAYYREMKTIKDLKKWLRGYGEDKKHGRSNVIYTGEAVVTFEETINQGILVQDETGAMLLRNENGNFSSSASRKLVEAGMKLTNISGQATDKSSLRLLSLLCSEDEAKSIAISEEKTVIPFKEYDSLDDFLAAAKEAAKPDATDPQGRNYSDMDGVAVKIKDVTVNKIGKRYETHYALAGTDTVVDFKHISVTEPVYPSKGEICGYNGIVASAPVFVYAGSEYCKPSAFFSIHNMKMFINEKNADKFAYDKFEISEPVCINHITNGKGQVYLFVQQTNDFDVISAIAAVANLDRSGGSEFDLEIGDSITGLKGSFTKFYFEKNGQDSIPHGSVLDIKPGDEKLLTKTGHTDFVSSVSHDVNVLLEAPAAYESMIIKLRKGTVVKKTTNESGVDVERYYYRSKGEVASDSFYIEVQGSVEMMAKYASKLGQEVHISGVYDMVTYERYTIQIRTDEDIRTTEMHFNSIKEMKDAGQPDVKTMLYILDSPVLVTYYRKWFGNMDPEYALFLRDATGSIGFRLGKEEPKTKIEEGDSLLYVGGRFYNPYSLTDPEEGYYWVYDDDFEKRLEIISTGNEIIPTEVNLKDLNENKLKYAFDRILVKDVEFIVDTQYIEGNAMARYLFREEIDGNAYTLQGSDAEMKKLELGAKYNVIGAMDFNRFGFGYAMYVLSTEKVDGNKVNNIVDGNIVYMTAEKQIVAEGAVEVVVFDIQGRRIMSSQNDRIDASALNKGMYIIRSEYDNGTVQLTKIVR